MNLQSLYNFAYRLLQKKKSSQFCEHHIYARESNKGIHPCKPEDNGAELFCKFYKDEKKNSILCSHKSPHNLEGLCDEFRPRKHLQADKIKKY